MAECDAKTVTVLAQAPTHPYFIIFQGKVLDLKS